MIKDYIRVMQKLKKLAKNHAGEELSINAIAERIGEPKQLTLDVMTYLTEE